MRTVLFLLLLAGCNKQTKPAAPSAALVFKQRSPGYPRLGATVLAGQPFAVRGDWSGECTQYEFDRAPTRSGRQSCSGQKFTLSASCEPACDVRVEGDLAWIHAETPGVHRINATLRGPTVASFELATTVLAARAFVISDCIVEQKSVAVYVTPTGTVCRLGAGAAARISVLASNRPIEAGLESFEKAAQAMRPALDGVPDYKTLAAFEGPIVDKFGVEVTVNGKPLPFIQRRYLEEVGRPVGPNMYAVTLEYADVRADVTFELLPPDGPS